MPYIFEFNDPVHRKDFRCQLQCVQCAQHKPNGQRCRGRTCIGTPYCWIHLLHRHHLRIKASNIPGAGKGLFVMSKDHGQDDIVFRKDSVIIEYDGEKVTASELDRRYGEVRTAPYGLQEGDYVEDGACRRGVGTVANHGHPRRLSNARFYRSRQAPRVFRLKATRHIRNGREVLVDYGDDYTFEKDVSHSTRTCSAAQIHRAARAAQTGRVPANAGGLQECIRHIRVLSNSKDTRTTKMWQVAGRQSRLKELSTVGDGDCFFHAVLVHLRKSGVRYHPQRRAATEAIRKLRQCLYQAVNHLRRSNPAVFRDAAARFAAISYLVYHAARGNSLTDVRNVIRNGNPQHAHGVLDAEINQQLPHSKQHIDIGLASLLMFMMGFTPRLYIRESPDSNRLRQLLTDDMVDALCRCLHIPRPAQDAAIMFSPASKHSDGGHFTVLQLDA